jgi:mycothiol synthase
VPGRGRSRRADLLREVYTWTQRGNAGMRALNTSLGFSTRTESLSMRASLPLAGLP